MLSPDSAGESDKKRWEMQINQGTWQNHVSAGGCRNFPDSFHLNPQYMYAFNYYQTFFHSSGSGCFFRFYMKYILKKYIK